MERESIVERYFGDVQGLSNDELRDLRLALNNEYDRRQGLRKVTEEEAALWRTGGNNKVRAIKLLRERLGIGLHDAKTLLENNA